METDFGKAEEVKISTTGKQIKYMPFYTTDQMFWMNGCMWDSEQEAIDSVKYDSTITRLRVMKIELPVLNVPENIDV